MCPFERNWDEKFAKLLKKKKNIKKICSMFQEIKCNALYNKQKKT